jgi:hypothetical protein
MASANQTTTGWVIFVAAVGMMFGMVSVDIVGLKDWNEMATPLFVGTTIGHIAAVIGAFVGGKIIPESRPMGTYTRATDIPAQKGSE